MSEFFFLIFLRGIQRVSVVSLYKISPCIDKTEILKLSLWICISEDFSIPVLLSEIFDTGIDLDLSTVFCMSIIWADLDLSNGLTVSFLLLLGLSNVLLDACDFSVF